MKGPKLLKNPAKRFSRKEIQTCPERMDGFGPWSKTEGLDTWKRVGPDRKCSFCGSMHPADFFDMIDRVLAEDPEDEIWLDPSDKSHKIYIHRKEVKNAGEGAIKFYSYHLRGLSEQDLAEARLRYTKAVQISRRRLHEWLEQNI